MLVGSDPLVRRVSPWPEGIAPFPEAEGSLEAWAEVARLPKPSPRDWQSLETQWTGSPAIPFSRGSRLGMMEVILADLNNPIQLDEALRWLVPVTLPEELSSEPSAAHYWTVLLPPTEPRSALLRVAERHVLLGWLDGPDIPLAPAAQAMQPGVYDRLLDSPTGALLSARASGLQDAGLGQQGQAALLEATTLALQEVSADRDGEQEAWRKAHNEAAARLGDTPQPINTLLRQAYTALAANAADTDSTGQALVAITAERLRNACPDTPCGGLDRTSSLTSAARWSPTSEALAAAWRVVAFKKLVDTVEVTHGRPNFSAHILDMMDTLVGTTSGSLDASLLTRRRLDETSILSISRMLPGSDTTDIAGLLKGLNQHLSGLCDTALSTQLAPDQRPLVERIKRRATD